MADIAVDIPTDLGGLRIDQALAALLPEYSRSRLQDWIKQGLVLVDGSPISAKQRIAGGEHVSLRPQMPATTTSLAEDIPLRIVHEDEDILIIDKPDGLVVHPAAGHAAGTLLNALLNHAPDLASLPRCGIVHRIDKDTTGLLMVARTLRAHKALVDQLQARSVHREYLALVQGTPVAGGTVDLPIGRHPVDRKRFAVIPDGKLAITHYRIERRFAGHTLLRIKLETGRTHQIRVHMTHLHYPLVGDPSYGRLRLPAGASDAMIDALRAFHRQALHAAVLGLTHPATGQYCQWTSPLPDDFQQLLEALDPSP
ncbi:MAG: 23S rRNA pseudouridine(1911/1915/1917) synthase RluD [Methylotetracoccus sp.]